MNDCVMVTTARLKQINPPPLHNVAEIPYCDLPRLIITSVLRTIPTTIKITFVLRADEYDVKKYCLSSPYSHFKKWVSGDYSNSSNSYCIHERVQEGGQYHFSAGPTKGPGGMLKYALALVTTCSNTIINYTIILLHKKTKISFSLNHRLNITHREHASAPVNAVMRARRNVQQESLSR